jgi:hypothetical protein
MKRLLFAAAALALVAGTALAPTMAAAPSAAPTIPPAPRYVWQEGYTRHAQLRGHWALGTPHPGWSRSYHGTPTPGQ